ncbi:hypothetical protein GGF46_001011 [Coemansia sp. RSA 552]|nr:hypothetical protein GGF46_001011 [Coemansia sp. RSA 552]
MIPDEKKCMPWTLPPLRSEPKEAAASEHFHYQRGTHEGYVPLEPHVSKPLSLRKRLCIFAGGASLLVAAVLLTGFGECPMHRGAPLTETTLATDPATIKAVRTLLAAASNDSNTVAWERLAEMTDLYGNRMTASKAYDQSVDWVVHTANKQDSGLRAYTEPVWVNEWKRNSESLRLFMPTRAGGSVSLGLLGLGNSVGTPPDGVEADVIPVHSFEELAQLGNATVAGKVVLFNFPFTGYDGTTVRFRSRGAVEAEKYGASAVLVRTLAPDTSFHSVHTGSSVRAGIPAASISLADANLIERMYERAQKNASLDHVLPRVKLVMNAKLRENAKQSSNVIIDLKGSERPEEIVLLSGHFDSWDVGVGAMDDGAGAFLAWEAARLIAATGRVPKRTVRVVMWNNEETLQRGSNGYFEQHRDQIKNHKFAVESDIGVFEPWGLLVKADHELTCRLQNYGTDLLGDLGAGNITAFDMDPGADISILCQHGVPCAGFLSVNPENGAAFGQPQWEDHYFRHHHASSDRIEIIDKHQLRRSAAALAAWAYLVADQ